MLGWQFCRPGLAAAAVRSTADRDTFAAVQASIGAYSSCNSRLLQQYNYYLDTPHFTPNGRSGHCEVCRSLGRDWWPRPSKGASPPVAPVSPPKMLDFRQNSSDNKEPLGRQTQQRLLVLIP